MSENKKDDTECVNIKIPFVSEEIIMDKNQYVNILKFLLFILGYTLTSFFHLLNIMEESRGIFYSFMISDSFMESIPEGFVVGLIFTFFKKK